MFPAIGTNVDIVPKVPLSPSEEPWILANWGNPAGQTWWLGALWEPDHGWHRRPSIVPQRREDVVSLKTHFSNHEPGFCLSLSACNIFQIPWFHPHFSSSYTYLPHLRLWTQVTFSPGSSAPTFHISPFLQQGEAWWFGLFRTSLKEHRIALVCDLRAEPKTYPTSAAVYCIHPLSEAREVHNLHDGDTTLAWSRSG